MHGCGVDSAAELSGLIVLSISFLPLCTLLWLVQELPLLSQKGSGIIAALTHALEILTQTLRFAS